MFKTALLVGGLLFAALGFYLANRQPHERPESATASVQSIPEIRPEFRLTRRAQRRSERVLHPVAKAASVAHLKRNSVIR